MRFFSLILGVALLLPFNATAGAVDQPLEMDEAFKVSGERTADVTFLIRWQIADGYHLYRDHLTAVDTAGKAIPLITAPGTKQTDPALGTIEIYQKSATALAPGAPARIQVTYHGSQEHGVCYPPTTKQVDFSGLPLSVIGLVP